MAMSLQVKPPEKKASPPPSFSSLPDEITVNFLARISRSYYPRLSVVSKSFRSLVSSTELYAERSHIGNTEHCLYVCLSDLNSSFQWFRLWINPNRTLPNMNKQMVHIPHLNLTSLPDSVAVVDSEIYVIGGEAPSSAIKILDCRSHSWRDAPSMNVARAYASLCVYDGKIYVLGGCKDDEPWAEVFDTKTQTWECLPDPGSEIRNVNTVIHTIMEIEGKINFGRAREMYAYDIKQGKWECCAFKYPKGDCVIENVPYSTHDSNSDPISFCYWFDKEGGCWNEVQGLDPLRGMYKTSYHRSKLVNCGGKMLHLWEERRGSRKKIMCAEIMVEKRDGGEVWGNVEWVDVVHTVPVSCDLLHCLAVSV